MEALLRCELFYDGWKLWVRHRHHGGSFMDCSPLEFEGLTLDELNDVLGATVHGWGVPPVVDRAF